MRTLTSVLMILVMVVFLAVPSTQASNCKVMTGTAHAQATGPSSAAGTATFVINGKTYSNINFVLNFTLTPNADGTISETSQHTFTIRDNGGQVMGTILTQDVGKATPTSVPGVYDLTLKLAIVGGTGDFADACGVIDDKGVLDARTIPTVDSALNGSVCHCD
jgi:hypothetical protein